jgi:hypothetical protein
MMRYRTEKRSDGHWVFDTYQGELCFATRTCDQTLAEQRAAALNAAYAAFRNGACIVPEKLRRQRRHVGSSRRQRAAAAAGERFDEHRSHGRS